MSNFSKKSYSVAISAAVAASALISGAANAQASQDSEVIRSVGTANSLSRSAVAQNVTSVSQLSDVRPTDWAFTALQSLVERYGCIAGYPDSTFRGNQATSRYEFAAGLNACLDKINEIISAGLADKVSQEDLATLQKLQEEFAAELATLRGRVDALDAKTAKLEAQQFSTTTKLRGEAVFSLSAGSDGVATAPGVDRTNLVFSYRARLNLDTSFTGKDLLRTRLQATNTDSFRDLAGSNSTRLSYDGFGSSGTANAFDINRLFYRFPIGEAVTAYIAPIGAPEDVISPLNPLESDSQGTISRFGRFNPLIRVASGGSPAVAGFDWKVSDKVNFQAMYSASNAGLATGTGGVTNGDSKIAAQFVFKPANNLTLGVGYANAYTNSNFGAASPSNLGSGLNRENVLGAVSPIKSDIVAGSLIWDITNKFTFNTWGSWTFANRTDGSASATLTSWAAALSGKDLFSDGDLAAVIFGQPLFTSSVTGIAPDASTPYHLEALYRFRVSKNITITPGVFFVFNQNSDSARGTATVGVIRTTFSF